MRDLVRIASGLLALIVLPGCGTFVVKPGSDPVIVYAQASAETAADVFDAFLRWERANEVVLKAKAPAVHATANEIRRSGHQWIVELRMATKIYKESPTQTNADKLKLAQQLIDLAVAEVRQRIAEGKL